VLFRSVLDWDESLYVLMAQRWLQGHLPYTTIWDNKPLGIYAIFALFIAIFHNPVLAIRLATSLFAAVTAIIVWRLAPLLLGTATPALSARLAGLAAAAFIIGSLSNDGLSANTELFMECFSAAAILAALHPGIDPARPFGRGVCVGMLFGLACMTH
jgi:4-amino-4-deoxy-L-arabinose transferase-like glycosyltransferase